MNGNAGHPATWAIVLMLSMPVSAMACCPRPSVAARSELQPYNAGPTRRGPIVCPQGTRWSGKYCVWQHILTDVRCPIGSSWDGTRCLAKVVDCPAPTRYDGKACTAATATAAATAPAPATATAAATAPATAPAPAPATAPAPAPATAPAATVKAKPTTLVLMAVGGSCRFAIDGQTLGRPTARLRRDVQPGSHRVSCWPRRGNVQNKKVTVEAQQQLTVRFDLVAASSLPRDVFDSR